jgi:putative restriction endonuclease
MPDYHFGHIEGVSLGDSYTNRQALRSAGIHMHLVAGIDGNPKVGSPSIVLNGGYVDDEDLGDTILYTGHGGNDPNSKRQIADQEWDATGNKALIVSELKGLPVRVTRGAKHKSPFSPKSGYQYGGLYAISRHFEQTGKDGYRICRFELEKLPEQKMVKFSEADLDRTRKKVTRTETTTLRIVRDSSLSRSVKELYDYSCQVCKERISVRDVPYAEGAHIKPLGRPHNGLDAVDNLLCLCPNHHVMLDKGAFSISDDFSLDGIKGTLIVDDKHELDLDNLAYHRDHIFIND